MNYKDAIALAGEGKEEGFRFLYEETYSKNYYIAMKYMKQEDAAQDVLQDAYVKAFSNLNQLSEADKFPAWFSKIVATKALDALKKKKMVLFSELEMEDGIGAEEMFEEEREEYRPEISMDRAETSRLIKEMIEELSDEQRMCILMFYMEQMSVREIAETVGASENTVKSRLNLGRQKIKEKVLLLEKKGTKLYGLGPVAFFASLLALEGKGAQTAYAAEGVLFESVATQVAAANATVASAGSASAMATAVTTSATAASAATSGLGSGFLGSMAFKVIAAIACVSVITVGATVAVQQMKSPESNAGQETEITKMPEATQTPQTPEEAGPTKEPGQPGQADVGEEGQDKVLYEDGSINVLVSGDTIYVRGTGVVPCLTQYIYSYTEEVETEIKRIVVEDGITGLGKSAFGGVWDIGEIILADSITSIGERALCGTAFQEIVLPETVTEIGSEAFDSCPYLKELVIPAGVQRLPADVIINCKELEKVTIPAGCVLEGDMYTTHFEKCPKLLQIVYGEGTTKVQLKVSHLNEEVETPDVKVQIPASATEISLHGIERVYGEEGSYAHRYASDMGIEFWVGAIGEEGAHRIAWLPEEIDWPVYPDNVNEYYMDYRLGFPVKGTLICVAYGKLETLSGHEDYLVDVGETLKNIFIEETVTEIDAKYFRKLEKLEYVIMENGVTAIGEEAFYGCKALKGVQLSEKLETLGAKAFCGCSALVRVELPETLTEIGANAFSGSGLKTVVFSEGLRIIGEEAFARTGLREVQLPDGVERIEKKAFADCAALHRVYIPESVTYIADDAFDMCGDYINGTYYTSSPELYRFAICGKAGSYAETYAKEHGYTFEITE